MKDSKLRVTTLLDYSARKNLMRFFRNKTRVHEALNLMLADDFEAPVHMTTTARALDEQEAVEFVVDALELLECEAIAQPRKFIPAWPADGADRDTVREWMRAFASSSWWFDTLNLSDEMKGPTFAQWMTKRPLHRDKIDAVIDRFADWLERAEQAIADSEFQQWASKFEERSDMRELEDNRLSKFAADKAVWDATPDDRKNWVNDVPQIHLCNSVYTIDSYFLRRMIDDQDLSAEDAENLFVRMTKAKYASQGLINFSGHMHGVRSHFGRSSMINEADVREEFANMIESKFRFGVSTLPPDGFVEREEWAEEDSWGDRRDETGPNDVNGRLYCKQFKDLVRVYWCREDNREKTELLRRLVFDGQSWVEANSEQFNGWQFDRAGYVVFMRSAVGSYDSTLTNAYSREIAGLESKIALASFEMLHGPFVTPDKADEYQARIDKYEAQLAAVQTR